jgi:nitrogen fixation/metabolism regulation signal transduction histidine kinase
MVERRGAHTGDVRRGARTDDERRSGRFGLGIAARLALLAAGLVVATAALGAVFLQFFHPWMAAALTIACMLPIAVGLVRSQLQPVLAMLRALGGTVTSYRDGDYSFGLHWDRDDEIGELVESHNALGEVLREQRLGLVQRELLLDTMVQNTPVAMLLVQGGENVVFANLAARQLLNGGKAIEGMPLARLLHRALPALREACLRGGDGLFTAPAPRGGEGEEEIYHLGRRQFSLNGRAHELLMLRHLTTELRRQEVQTWKKVLRVISHELNNSLAPVASLAASGLELLRRGRTERLPEVLQTVEDRARHLERFIEGYARFAKLPAPRIETVEWAPFVRALQVQVPFVIASDLPEASARIDPAQMEQALLNLLKNAHESGSAPEHVSLAVRFGGDATLLEVCDRGSGMSETVMANAIVPFYSTKRTGTGLGLALAREIVEAHGGRIAMHNREAGGLAVVLVLPV